MKYIKAKINKILTPALFAVAIIAAMALIPSNIAIASDYGDGIGSAGFGSDWEDIGSYSSYSPSYGYSSYSPSYGYSSYTPSYGYSSYTPSYSSAPSYSYSPSRSSYVPSSGGSTYHYASTPSCSSCGGYSYTPARTYSYAAAPSGSNSSSYSSSPNYVYVSSSNTNNNTNTNTNTATANASNNNNISNVFNPTNNNDARINLVVLGGGTTPTTPVPPVYPPYYPPVYPTGITASCYINPSNAYVGQNVTFTANAYGGSGYYTYSWTGTDGLSASGQTFTGTFSYPGTKYVTVTVYSNGQSATASCNAYVQGNTYTGGATVIRDNGTPVSGVYLSQVPATGIDAKNLKMILFTIGLLMWSAFAAYIVNFKRKNKLAAAGVSDVSANISARIEAFKQRNMEKKGLVS